MGLSNKPGYYINDLVNINVKYRSNLARTIFVVILFVYAQVVLIWIFSLGQCSGAAFTIWRPPIFGYTIFITHFTVLRRIDIRLRPLPLSITPQTSRLIIHTKRHWLENKNNRLPLTFSEVEFPKHVNLLIWICWKKI